MLIIDNHGKRLFLFSIGYAAIGFVMGKIGSYVGAAFGGAGHGTAFFYAIVSYPFPYGDYFWPLIGFGLPWTRLIWVRAAIIILLIIKYVSVFLDMDASGIFYLVKTVKSVPEISVPFIVVYVASILFIIRSLVWPNKTD